MVSGAEGCRKESQAGGRDPKEVEGLSEGSGGDSEREDVEDDGETAVEDTGDVCMATAKLAVDLFGMG